MPTCFFSFSESNRHTVAKIKGRAVNKSYSNLNFKVQDLLRRWNTSDETVIRQAITKQLFGTSRTIVFVGELTYKSKWVAHEVEVSIARGKKVFAIWLKDKTGPIPKYLSDRNIRVYQWSEARLQDLATR